MFDLVSTRTGTDPQSAACARLLASIIADAVRQASKKPSRTEIERKQNIDAAVGDHPAISVWFLFDEDSPFSQYAHLIGLDAQAMRDALLSDRPLNETTTKGARPYFTAAQRRVIKIRHKFYLLQRHSEQAQKTKE